MVEDPTKPWYFNEVSGRCEEETPFLKINRQEQQEQQLEPQQQEQEPNHPELMFDNSPYIKEVCCCKCGKDDYEACQECNNCVCRG